MGCPDIVSFGHDGFAAVVETLGGARKGERDGEPEQGEDGTIDDARSGLGSVIKVGETPPCDATAEFHRGKQCRKSTRYVRGALARTSLINFAIRSRDNHSIRRFAR